MNNEQKQVFTYGVKMGVLKRRKSAIWRFLWQFLLVAVICIGIPFGVLMLIAHDNQEGFPQYNRELRNHDH